MNPKKVNMTYTLSVGRSVYCILTNKKICPHTLVLTFINKNNPEKPLEIRDDGKGNINRGRKVLSRTERSSIDYSTGEINFTLRDRIKFKIEEGDTFSVSFFQDIDEEIKSPTYPINIYSKKCTNELFYISKYGDPTGNILLDKEIFQLILDKVPNLIGEKIEACAIETIKLQKIIGDTIKRLDNYNIIELRKDLKEKLWT